MMIKIHSGTKSGIPVCWFTSLLDRNDIIMICVYNVQLRWADFGERMIMFREMAEVTKLVAVISIST